MGAPFWGHVLALVGGAPRWGHPGYPHGPAPPATHKEPTALHPPPRPGAVNIFQRLQLMKCVTSQPR